jgi:hypothetical protein
MQVDAWQQPNKTTCVKHAWHYNSIIWFNHQPCKYTSAYIAV